MKTAIITISIGNRPWFKRVKKLMIIYCKKYNHDFIVINGQFSGDINARIKKLEVGNYLEKYDRILYLDDTVIINPLTPNIFDIVPKEYLGVVLENAPYFDKYQNLIDSLKYYDISLNGINRDNYMWFNSGVILASKCHRNLFNKPNKSIIKIGNYVDQSFFNANRYKYNISLMNLGLRYNYMGTRLSREEPYKIDDVDNIYFYHVTRAFRDHTRKKIMNRILSQFGY